MRVVQTGLGYPALLMPLSSLITLSYAVCLGTLVLWGLHRLALLHWLNSHDPTPPGPDQTDHAVMVQLPLYNEAPVAARLIDAVARLDWPQLRIQVLDDSTDRTTTVVADRVRHWASRGVAIAHVRRPVRTGYKAGALRDGLALDSAPFVAIFDADFVPEPDFLRRSMRGFHDPSVGMVQARWGHINRNDDWLTRIQALLLDGHFIIEHAARYRTGRFFNFNGTAGVWRRETIEDAGGWAHDTVTEDLDLSYRAQLRGWRFVYLDQLVAPAEVPASMGAFLTQQHRWAKGTVQTARKLLLRVATAPVGLRVRLEAVVHLTMVAAYPMVFGLAVLLPLSILARSSGPPSLPLWVDGATVAATTLSIAAFYATAMRRAGDRVRNRWWEIPVAMAIGVGCSASQTLAVVDGLVSDDATFVRTPKRGDSARPAAVPRVPKRRLVLTGLMAGYYAVAALGVAAMRHWVSLPIVLLFAAGFAATFIRLATEGSEPGEAVERELPQPAS